MKAKAAVVGEQRIQKAPADYFFSRNATCLLREKLIDCPSICAASCGAWKSAPAYLSAEAFT